MNDNLIKTARSRAHRVLADDAVLRRAREFNKNPRTEPVPVFQYTTRLRVRDQILPVKRTHYASDIRAARAAGREFARMTGFAYINTELSS